MMKILIEKNSVSTRFFLTRRNVSTTKKLLEGLKMLGMGAFVLNNYMRSSWEQEIFHLAASRQCEFNHFSELTEVLDHR